MHEVKANSLVLFQANEANDFAGNSNASASMGVEVQKKVQRSGEEAFL